MPDFPPILRQWILLRALSHRRYGMTVRDMAAESGVSEKTVRRDLQTLLQAGFRLKETRSDHGRKHWRLEPDGCDPALSFNFAELASLYLGRQFLEPLAGTLLWESSQSAFAKIRSSVGEAALNYLEQVRGTFCQTCGGVSDYSKRAEIIDRLMIGAEDCRFTSLTYQSMRSTEPVTYDVYPYGLVYHRGRLYLIAFAPEHDEVRHYRVDRIEDAELLDLRFVKPADFDLKRYLNNSFGVYRGKGAGFRIKVKFLPTVARYVEESQWHPSQELTKQPDGSLIAEFHLGDTEEIKQWLLGFGPNTIVLAPASLRNDIIADLRQMTANYCLPVEAPQPKHTQASVATSLPRKSRTCKQS